MEYDGEIGLRTSGECSDCLQVTPHQHCKFIMKLVSNNPGDPVLDHICNKPTRNLEARYCWHHSRH